MAPGRCLPKVTYVGTTVLVFTWINWIKLPFYCLDRNWVDWGWVPSVGIINGDTLRLSALLLPVVPIGVWLGVWLNRKFSEEGFFKVIYALVFLAGVQLIFNFDLTKLVPR